MVMCRNQNAGRNHNTKIGNSSFERLRQFKYLRTALITIVFKKNYEQMEVK